MDGGDLVRPVHPVDDAAGIHRIVRRGAEVARQADAGEQALLHALEQDLGGDRRPQRQLGMGDQVGADEERQALVVLLLGELDVAAAVIGLAGVRIGYAVGMAEPRPYSSIGCIVCPSRCSARAC